MPNAKRNGGALSEHELWLENSSEQLALALEKIELLEHEIHSLEGYISWKGLDVEYAQFKKEVREEYEDDLPFPQFVM